MPGGLIKLATTLSDWLLDPMNPLSPFMECPSGLCSWGRKWEASAPIPLVKTCPSVFTFHTSGCANVSAKEYDTHERSPGTGRKGHVAQG